MFEDTIINLFKTSDKSIPSDESFFNEFLGDNFMASFFSKDYNEYNLEKITSPDGKIEKYVLKLVYAPFKKKNLEISCKNNTLTINLIKSLKETINDLHYDKNINTKVYKLPISQNEKIDDEHIIAKTDEGVLIIELPIINNKNNNDSRKITIS